MAERKAKNPFYFLLVLVGIAFCVTACAFGVMTLRGVRSPQPVIVEAGTPNDALHPLMNLMEERGMTLITVELVLLAIFTFAAMATDSYWTNRHAAEDAKETQAEANSHQFAANIDPKPTADAEQGVT